MNIYSQIYINLWSYRPDSAIETKFLGSTPSRAYSTAVQVNDGLTFVSGQVGYDKEAGGVIQGGFEAETRESLNNLQRALV